MALTPEAKRTAFMPGVVLALLAVFLVGLTLLALFLSLDTVDFKDYFYGWLFVSIIGMGVATLAAVLVFTSSLTMLGEKKRQATANLDPGDRS